MSSDTGEGTLSSAERRAIKAARGVDDGQQIIIVRDGAKSGGDSFGKFKDIIFVAIVLGMGGVTWGQSISTAKLETTVVTLEKAVSDLTQEVKALQQRTKP